MKKLLDYDPLTHTKQYHSYDTETDITTIETVQDVEPYLEQAKQLRNDEQYSRDGIKNEFWHYATIPNGVIEQIRQKYGVDVFSPGDSKKVLKIINQDYPYLKATTKNHA